jgi:hypothetical protein
MPPSKQRPPASVAVTKAAIAQATASLEALPARPKESWSLREAVNMLQDSITTALDRGYSYEEVSVLLAGKGVTITPSSLKRYLATAKKDGTVKTSGKRGRTPRATKAAGRTPKAAAEAAPEAEAASEATPTKRRGRGPNKAKAAAAPKTTRAAAARKSTSGTTKLEAKPKVGRGRKKKTES